MKHVLIAFVLQALVFLFSGSTALGAAFATAYFIGREIAQAEYRGIEAYYEGKRANAPWWVGFQARNWNTKSMLDWILPALATHVVALAFPLISL